ncbi:hypothetical protein EOD41_19085 [Mucilaginibacter limnophilus]|uniref:Transglycosylase SLT domain-containing protein n=1 Tax=Mucilaginibacter limnophilus TaxID=1932778 RepID=A0A3S2UZN1_9SPHI|nr:hypothetical protein [Mucilaginibacter limnophilus]RVT97270.1 hypothetical protein EOD41_19085 [Mucilaginibacter limnophilus]
MFTCVKKKYSLLILLVLCQQCFAFNYREVFGGRYIQAEKKIADLRPLIQQYAREYNEDSRLIEAVIFPEVMRYNSIYNAVETGSLMGLYSRFGADYADFSIGLLQMKPTFAEAIEKEVQKHSSEKWVSALGFDHLDLKDNYDSRMARITRLTKPEWQVKYFIAMLKCINLKHKISALKEDERLLFIAAAYNCGWNKSAAVIRTYIPKKFYHLGNWDSGERYAFADVAMYRYNELKRETGRLL